MGEQQERQQFNACAHNDFKSNLTLLVCFVGADVVRELLKARPDFASKLDGQGFSPLHLASSRGHAETTKEFLRLDPELCFQRDSEGRMPLHLAAIGGRVSVLNAIISTDLRLPWMLTKRRETVLHLSVKNDQYEAVRYLVEKLDITNLVNFPDDDGNTILHLAAAGKLTVALELQVMTEKTLNSRGQVSYAMKSVGGLV
ncbi:hypothetical protein ACLOJK_040192 [Asimina triloba]